MVELDHLTKNEVKKLLHTMLKSIDGDDGETMDDVLSQLNIKFKDDKE